MHVNNGKLGARLLMFLWENQSKIRCTSLHNKSLTPHIGAATTEAQDRIGTELADKIITFYQK